MLKNTEFDNIYRYNWRLQTLDRHSMCWTESDLSEATKSQSSVIGHLRSGAISQFHQPWKWVVRRGICLARDHPLFWIREQLCALSLPAWQRRKRENPPESLLRPGSHLAGGPRWPKCSTSFKMICSERRIFCCCKFSQNFVLKVCMLSFFSRNSR